MMDPTIPRATVYELAERKKINKAKQRKTWGTETETIENPLSEELCVELADSKTRAGNSTALFQNVGWAMLKEPRSKLNFEIAKFDRPI